MNIVPGLRFFTLARRAVVALESLAHHAKATWEESHPPIRLPKPFERGVLDQDLANRNWRRNHPEIEFNRDD